jgi:hypothetical protein
MKLKLDKFKAKNDTKRKSNKNSNEFVFIESKMMPPGFGPGDELIEIPGGELNIDDFDEMINIDDIFTTVAGVVGRSIANGAKGSLFPNGNEYDIARKEIYQKLLNVVTGVEFGDTSTDFIIKSECINLLAIFYNTAFNSVFDLLTINYSLINVYSNIIGDTKLDIHSTTVKNSMIPLLLFSLAYNIDIDSPELCIFGFIYDKGSDRWHSLEKLKPVIKMRDHPIGEALVCPLCEKMYYNSTQLLFAQINTVVPVKMSSNHSSSEDVASNIDQLTELKMMAPSVVMTPICASCHIGYVEKNLINMHNINSSPYFCYPVDERKVVPLIPECMFNDLKNKNVNMYAGIEDRVFSYWPVHKEDSVCATIKTDIANKIEIAKKKQESKKEEKKEEIKKVVKKKSTTRKKK